MNGTEADLEKVTTQIICYAKPQKFAGSESAEILFERNFETICLSLSEQLHIQPKAMTVLEFYNAYSFLLDRARKAQKRG